MQDAPNANKETPQELSNTVAPVASAQVQNDASRLKRWWRSLWHSDQRIISFEELYRSESEVLGDPVDKQALRVSNGVAGEPWIAFTPKDRFGLALSGGGIRSATFNLGLLQALGQLGVLRHVHYLSTVSGGGYIGGFWTTWLHRQGNRAGGGRFPLGNDQRGGERAEIRHLREFSRFLLPRIGLFETELWSIVMTILGGVLPSLLAATALLVLMWWAWAGLLACLLNSSWKFSLVFSLLATYFVFSEIRWFRLRNSEHNRNEMVGYCLTALIGSLALASAWSSRQEWLATLAGGGFAALKNTGVALLPAEFTGAATVALLLMRSMIARFFFTPGDVSILVGIERSITRLLGLSAALIALGVLWCLASVILQNNAYSLRVTEGMTASTTLFLWLRKWLAETPKETYGGNLLRDILNLCKQATPRTLAIIAWILFFILVGTGVQWAIQNTARAALWKFLAMPTASLIILGLIAWLFDPARVGLHEFYRSRISRCYMGASNAEVKNVVGGEAARAAQNRYICERPGDDLTLGDLAKKQKQPIQLICTAANAISGDSVGTLYRGARSAVLSIHGITLGDQTAALNDLRLSAALTASAAAFNSQMGRISMSLGPAVTFLMSALNLRLGLWVPHPANPRRRRYRMPGLRFFAELLGKTRTDGKDLHLSDGNHFENLGLYELIRRHCRHIIVSDCGADPALVFDDLANVLRRVREDFGVEIELDISKLRSGADGFGRQHAVTGTIHYNGPGGMDKGTILYFKPVLTGDEPPDVLQYKVRNKTFPHETTGDQFYDEAQWESYRRLGEHAGRIVLGFLDRPNPKPADGVDRLFMDARSRWHPSPDRLNEDFIAMSQRCAELEQSLAASGPLLLRMEFFPEAAELAANAQPKEKQKTETETGSTDELEILSFLLRAIQIMEDVWVSADLDQFWSHPLNEGWMGYFHRWSATPSFRRWWPILAPIYSLGFREFVKERFAVGASDQEARQQNERPFMTARLHLRDLADDPKFKSSRAWMRFIQLRPKVESSLSNKRIFGYELQLLDRNGALDNNGFLVGFVLVTESPNANRNGSASPSDESTAEWTADEFFVPPTLHGSGIVSRMLDAVIQRYKNMNSAKACENSTDVAVRMRCVELRVRFAGSSEKTPSSDTWKAPVLGKAARYERVRDIEFYKSRGFRYQRPEHPKTGAIVLHLKLWDTGITE